MALIKSAGKFLEFGAIGAGWAIVCLYASYAGPLHHKGNASARPPSPNVGRSPPSQQRAARADRFGDRLPPDALLRIGTVRFRHHDGIQYLAVSPDGKLAASGGGWLNFTPGQPIRIWEVATGQEIRQLDFWEVVAMSLVELLPEVQSLSRIDKTRLIQFLARELEQDETGLIEKGESYPVWSPDRAFTAAAALLQALEDE